MQKNYKDMTDEFLEPQNNVVQWNIVSVYVILCTLLYFVWYVCVCVFMQMQWSCVCVFVCG